MVKLHRVAMVSLSLLASGCVVVPMWGHRMPRATDVEVTRGAPAGVTQRVSYFYGVNPDCTSAGLPQVTVLRSPQHGALNVTPRDEYPDFPRDNQRYDCNMGRVPSVVVLYTSEPGFRGRDEIEVNVVFPSGAVQRRTIKVDVS